MCSDSVLGDSAHIKVAPRNFLGVGKHPFSTDCQATTPEPWQRSSKANRPCTAAIEKSMPSHVTVPKRQLLRRNVKRFRGGLVFKAHALLYHSILGLRVIKKKKKSKSDTPPPAVWRGKEGAPQQSCHQRESAIQHKWVCVWGVEFEV